MVKNIQRCVNALLPRAVVRWLKRHLAIGQFTYNRDGLATWANADFLKDPLFSEAYRLAKETQSFSHDVQWRVMVGCWAAWQVKELDGDFVECGVNRGGLSRAVMHYVGFQDLKKTFYLLDTFCGLVDDQISEREREHGITEFQYSECFESVKNTFAEFKNVEIVRGAIPGTLDHVKASRVCYLHIDMNCAAPEIAAAEYFWDKLVPGGIILLDDYGWPNHIVQKQTFDEFAAHRGVQILGLPTGQGMIIKPSQSAAMPIVASLETENTFAANADQGLKT
jgi:hypothetical protein